MDHQLGVDSEQAQNAFSSSAVRKLFDPRSDVYWIANRMGKT